MEVPLVLTWMGRGTPIQSLMGVALILTWTGGTQGYPPVGTGRQYPIRKDGVTPGRDLRPVEVWDGGGVQTDRYMSKHYLPSYFVRGRKKFVRHSCNVRVQSTMGGYVFTGVCLLIGGRRRLPLVPGPFWDRTPNSGSRSFLGEGSTPPSGPRSPLGEYPKSGQGYSPGQGPIRYYLPTRQGPGQGTSSPPLPCKDQEGGYSPPHAPPPSIPN